MTPPAHRLALAALERFGIPSASTAQFVRHGENTTYRIQAPDGRTFALRLHRPGYHTIEALRSELAWMLALRSAGIPAPAPFTGQDGDMIQRIEIDESRRTAMLFDWVQGVPLSSLDGTQGWVTLGETMAAIHEHGRSWRRPASFIRPAWDEEALVGENPRWGDPDPHGHFSAAERRLLDDCRSEVRRRLISTGHDRSCYGLIHGDLGFENVLIATDAAIVIDFDDCGDGWFVHELAVALYPYEGTADFAVRRDALVGGYRRRGTLPDAVLAELPTFMMARRLATLGWVFSRAETDHAAAQRERRLRTSTAAAREFLAWAIGDRRVLESRTAGAGGQRGAPAVRRS